MLLAQISMRAALRSFQLIGLTVAGGLFTPSQETPPARTPAASVFRPIDQSDLDFYTNGRPYMELPLEELAHHIPELKDIQPSKDQQSLLTILEKTGMVVDQFFLDITNVIAHEDITQQITRENNSRASMDLQYSYLIVLNRDEKPPRFEEYRMNKDGEAVTSRGTGQGFAVTSGFTLKCIHFSSAHRYESRFRHLGYGRLGQRNTYVVVFAQESPYAKISESVKGAWGTVPVYIQGIVWIDRETFQILRLRTDLLAPPASLGLYRETTEITFTETSLQDYKFPLWLPSSVNVEGVFDGQIFHNEHRYSDYKRYRVSVKMKAPAAG